MRIVANLTNDKLEQLYEKLDEEIINLPQQFKNLRLGLLPKICQLFITALKSNSNTKVKFYKLESNKEHAVSELLTHPECLTALLMSDSVYEKDRELDEKKIELELKSKINIDIQKRLNESIFKRAYRVQLFAVDHSAKKYAFPSCFYLSEDSNLLKKSQFYTKLLTRLLDIIPYHFTISENHLNNLGQVIYELIENTEQHGKFDFNTGKADKSVRGLIIDHNLITKMQTSESIGGENSAITSYLKAIRIANPTVHLLEISIFDSGQGVFKSLEANNTTDISLKDEVKVVEKSFAKGVTSKPNPHGYGRGLFNVRNVLDERKGFISLRTGRIGVYRDFCSNPLSEKEKEPLSLFDEISKSTKNYTQLAQAEGLACSILVPIQ